MQTFQIAIKVVKQKRKNKTQLNKNKAIKIQMNQIQHPKLNKY